MKFGVVSYERKKISLSGKNNQNIGDWVQTIAMENLYREWGIDNYVFVSRNDIKDYTGEYIVLPFNGFNTLINKVSYEQKTFPLSDRIFPVFFSMHFHDPYMPQDMIEQLKQYSPVGCRDEKTMINLREKHIDCYLSGCITATLPKREETDKQKKIFAVDVPEDALEYIPEEYKEDLEIKTHNYLITRTSGEPYMNAEESKAAYEHTKAMLNMYRDEAKLIITSRLHVASPCMAMGIPVVLVANDFDWRFSWIDKYLPLYRKGSWDQIDWHPTPVNFEETKKMMKKVLKEKLFSLYEQKKDEIALSELWEERNKNDYEKLIRSALSEFKAAKVKEYMIWGVVTHTLRVTNVIQEELPDWKLTQAVDKNVRGLYNGIEICSSDNAHFDRDTVCVVMANKAKPHAVKLLNELGARYILVDITSSCWENNFH